jgi:serine protease Do
MIINTDTRTALLLLLAVAGCGNHDGKVDVAAHPALGRQAHGIADVAERSLPAVVNIASTKVVHSQGHPFMSDPFFRQFFGDRMFGVPRARRKRSLGSGVIISKDGVVLTNYHVVERAQAIKVVLSDRRELAARLVGADPKSDMAVLRLEGDLDDLRPLPLGDSSKLRLGDVVLAIGNPFGVGQTVTMGIVSAKGRANVGIVDYEDFIQTDAAINPGNSGGALVNMRGELVGINTAILSRSGGYQGVGFAIPSNMARPIMESLLSRGKVVRGWLGASVQELSPDLARALGLKATDGVLVSDVAAGSPAARAGVRRGDVIQRINGEQIDTPGRLRNLVASAGAGARIKLGLLRKGSQPATVEIQLTEMPTTAGGVTRLGRREGALGGLTVVGLSPAVREKYNLPERLSQGVVIEQVARGSAAARAGLRPGDVILELNRQPIVSVDQFASVYRQSRGQLLLLVYRDGETSYLLFRR